MEVALVIAMFIATALSLNFIVNDSKKLAGTCNVVNLCLIVAVAYQFELVDTIIMVLIVLAILIIVTMVLLQKRKKAKLQQELHRQVIENKED